MFLGIKAIIFAVAAFNAYDVPLAYGHRVFIASIQEGVNPLQAISLLAAENQAKKYDPSTVGKYNGGGELGLFQLQPYPWAKFCGIHKDELKHPMKNIDCAVKVIKKLQQESGVQTDHLVWLNPLMEDDFKKLSEIKNRRTRDGLPWQTRYRCTPKSRSSVNCHSQVNKVFKMYDIFLNEYSNYDTSEFWLRAWDKKKLLLDSHVRVLDYLSGIENF